VLASKGLSFIELYKFIDSDRVGLISEKKFSKRLREMIPGLSRLACDQLFGFMDKQNTGLINQASFLEYIGKSLLKPMPEVTEDNFDWELAAIKRLREWRKEENVSMEDAFRVIDQDFDGNISKNDLRKFLEEIFKIQVPNESKLNRMLRLMDHSK
jgi:Ca2+-binding EF-hand superfamily protein